ncbi:MAG: thiamine pyrophosphate-dependent enzyme [Candidatus Acetothermia bacterium]
MSFDLKRPLPYCPGCGHHHIASATASALDDLNYDPLEAVLVTDIGCVGLADKYFPCHTIHGLHGRSAALAHGVRLGLEEDHGQVIVFVGDGGATIGLQHLMEAARLNVNLTVLLHNNMLYGMTGGQSSGLTPCGYRTTTEPEGSISQSYNLPKMVHETGASHSARILETEDVTEEVKRGVATEGFSLIEIVETCYSYGKKYNTANLEDLLREMGRETGRWLNEDSSAYREKPGDKSGPLLDQLPETKKTYNHSLSEQFSLIAAGSAGEGVQTACTVLAGGAMQAGLEVSKRGEYPVTVGSGFSICEVLLSPTKVLFTGISEPDVMIVTSEEGLDKRSKTLQNLESGNVYLDDSLSAPSTDAELHTKGFREAAGPKGAALSAISYWIDQSGLIPPEALMEAAEKSKHSEALQKSIQSGIQL